jgi:hypothetical protein
MHSSWQDDCIEFGGMPLDAVGDEFSEPVGLTNTIMDNLAILLQPQFPGTQISMDLRANANKGYIDMKAKFQTITIPKLKVRETLPRGQGNKRYRYSSDAFFDKGDELGS